MPIGSLPPRLRRDSSAGVRDLARSLDLHSRFLPFTRPRPCSMDRRSNAQTCGLAKEGSQKRALAPKAMRLKKGLLKRKRQGVITRG